LHHRAWSVVATDPAFIICAYRPWTAQEHRKRVVVLRRIPQHFRANVDSKQVGKYLDRVLAIIGEYDER